MTVPSVSQIVNRAKKVSKRARIGTVSYSVEAYGFAAGIQKLETDLTRTHANAVGQLTKAAKRNFQSRISRPWESGDRPADRMTGKFTFGYRGTFSGNIIRDDKAAVHGFAYPNIERADQRTRFVWRSLEFGLGDYRSSHPLAPRGQFKMPLMRNGVPGFWKGPQGQQLLRPAGRAQRVEGGIPGRFFLTDAWYEVVGNERAAGGSWLQRQYRQIETDVSMEFQR